MTTEAIETMPRLAPPAGVCGEPVATKQVKLKDVLFPGTRCKIGHPAWNKGIHESPAHRAKISAALKKRTQPWDHAMHNTQHTEAAKKKMSQARTKWWERKWAAEGRQGGNHADGTN